MLLRAGETFAGHFTLPVKSGTGWITIRSDASDSQLPPDGTRLVPSDRPGGNTPRSLLARIVGLGGSFRTTPLLQTAPGAHHYRIEFIEFDGLASEGYQTLVQIGTDTTSAPPTDIIFDRVWVHGHPTKGQKRGIAINGVRCDVLNSYINDIKAVGVDSQAILGYNGAGPFRIINNYIEAAGENIMFGGADPAFDGLVPADITVQHNHLYKPLEWRDDILAQPGSVSASAATGGSLTAGTHYFKVVAVMTTGGATVVSTPSAEVAMTVASSGAARLTWGGVVGADRYRVYRGSSTGAESRYLDTSGPATSFTYTGSGEQSGTPATHGTRWTVKNLFELKNAERVTVEGNIMENCWLSAQPGYAIVLTPRNSSGRATWSRVRDVTFRNNIIRHAAGAVNILGYDDLADSGRAENVLFANNLFDDINHQTYGGGLSVKAILLGSGPSNVQFQGNTIIHTNTSLVYAYGSEQMPGFVYTNNLSKHNKYGILGDGTATGTSTITRYFPDGNVTCNVLAGGPASAYPQPNAFPTLAEWGVAFVDLAAGDYHLVAGSVIAGMGCNGAVPGLDVDALNAALVVDDDGGGGDPPPSTTNEPPVASPGGPYAGAPGSSINVNGGGSFDPDGTIAAWRWAWTDDVLVRAADLPSSAVQGSAWTLTPMADAAGGAALVNPDGHGRKVAKVLASPSSYVEFTVQVAAGVPYRLWLRMRAQDDRDFNDSLYVQFSGATTADGAATARIGTTSAIAVALEENNAGPNGWGWNDGSSSGLADPIMFAVSGPQTIRIQECEHGVMWDQLVLSAATYGSAAPGPARADATILPATFGTTGAVTAAHTYDVNGIYPLLLTVTDNAGASASASTTVTIGGSAERSTGLTADAGGPYSGVVGGAVVFDGRGSLVPSGATAKYGWLFGDEVVLHADAFNGGLHGRWQVVSDSSAADGLALENANRDDAKVSTPAAAPANYVEATFRAAAGVPYMMWVRMQATGDAWTNDSVWVQFSGSVDSAGQPAYRTGTTSALPVILEELSGAGVSGWGWTDARYGGLAEPLYFEAGGEQTIRIQQREDGVRIDQIVISAVQYQSSPPGATKQDGTIVPVIAADAWGALVQRVYWRAGTYPVTLVLFMSDGESRSTSTAVIAPK